MDDRPPRRRLHRAVASLLLAGLLAAGACGDDADQADTPPSDDASESTAGEDAAADRATDERNGVEVLDAGAAPFDRLVLQPAVGTELERTLVNRIGVTLQIDGQELPSMPLPATRLVLRSRVDGVDDDGTIRSTVTIVDVAAVDAPGVDPAVLAQATAALEPMRGLTGTGTTDRHGGSQNVSLDTSTIDDPALAANLEAQTSQLSNLSVVLPAQPVGEGASWRVRRSVTLNGIETDTTTTYTLRSRSGNDYVIDLAQDATAAPGPVDIPGLPGGGSATIETFAVHSTGEVRGRLDQPLPDNSSLQGGGDIAMTVGQGGDAGSLSQQLTIDVTLSPEG